MKRLIEFALQDGGVILVELNEPEPIGGVERVGRYDELLKSSSTFEAALGKIRPVAETIINHLQGLKNQPDEVGVEFAFKLSGKADLIIASADTEGNFKVNLKWTREKRLEKPDSEV